MRLKFQKRSELKFVSRTIPLKAEGNKIQIPKRSATEFVSRIIPYKQGYDTQPLGGGI